MINYFRKLAVVKCGEIMCHMYAYVLYSMMTALKNKTDYYAFIPEKGTSYMKVNSDGMLHADRRTLLRCYLTSGFKSSIGRLVVSFFQERNSY